MKGRAKVTALPIGRDGLIGAEAYEITSSNGLMKAGIRFGMTKNPDRPGGGGETEVREAFADLAKRIHQFAAGLEAVAPPKSGGAA